METNNWITAEALSDAMSMLPTLRIARDVVPKPDGTPLFPLAHGCIRTLPTHIETYCACCDAFTEGDLKCSACGAPWDAPDDAPLDPWDQPLEVP